MVYRETERTRANARSRRADVERAARHVVAQGGFVAASISAIAAEAECSPGLIYTYYSGRDELLGRVFEQAAGHELGVIARSVDAAETVSQVVDAVVSVFVERAVTGRRMAHALLLEPVPETVQKERAALRRGYVAAIAAGLDRVRSADDALNPQSVSAEVAARSLVGAISENLVDVLDTERPAPHPMEIEALIRGISRFAGRALATTDTDLDSTDLEGQS